MRGNHDSLSKERKVMTSRVRVDVDTTETKDYPNRWYRTGGNFPVDKDVMVTYVAKRLKRSMVDVVTPGYHKMQNQGVIINNPLHFEQILTRTIPLQYGCDWWWSGYQGETQGPFLGALEIPDANPLLPDVTLFEKFFEPYENYEALAVNRSWAKVELSEAMVLASLGELPETIKWFRTIMQRAVRLTKLFRGKTGTVREFKELFDSFRPFKGSQVTKLVTLNSKKKVPYDFIGDFANAWLEYRYAIRPLIFEAQQCLAAMKKVIKKGTRQTARGKEVNLVDFSDVVSHHYADPGCVIDTTAERTVKATYSCRAGVLFEIEDDLDAMLAVWGVDQPLESVWELVPFSFILDWFFNIGNTISAWSVNPSLTPLASWVTYSFVHHEKRRSLSCEWEGVNGYTFNVTDVSHGLTELHFNRKWRKPAPERRVLPRFDLKLDLAKIIDLGLIGRSLLSGKSPKFQKGA